MTTELVDKKIIKTDPNCDSQLKTFCATSHQNTIKWHAQIRAVKWSNVIYLGALHLLFPLGLLYIWKSGQTISVFTVAFAYVIGAFSGMGISGKKAAI